MIARSLRPPTDNVDTSLATTCAPVSGSTFLIGTTTVTRTAKDAAGNIGARRASDVLVRDTTPPVLSAAGAHQRFIAATSAAGTAVTFTATALDAVDGTLRPVVCAPASGSTFVVGATNVSCSSSDTRGNSTSGTFTVTVTLSSNAIGKFVACPAETTLWLRAKLHRHHGRRRRE